MRHSYHSPLKARTAACRNRLPQSLLLTGALLFSFSCGKRPPPLPAPPPVQPGTSASTRPADRPVDPSFPAPLLSARIEPSVVNPSESAILSWESQNADQVTIDQRIGTVGPSGRIKIFPDETTTYRITADGRGGFLDQSVTVEVRTAGSSAVREEDLDHRTMAEQFESSMKPIFFDFDSAELREESRLTLAGNIRWLLESANRGARFVIEGHCDDRGTEEYNLALGDKRARVVADFMIGRGIDPSRVQTLSLGEEQPFAPGQSEEAYALNRRAQFVLTPE